MRVSSAGSLVHTERGDEGWQIVEARICVNGQARGDGAYRRIYPPCRVVIELEQGDRKELHVLRYGQNL